MSDTAAPVMFTEMSIIVIAVCVTLVLLSLIFYARKFKIQKGLDGISFEVGQKKPGGQPVDRIDSNPDLTA